MATNETSTSTDPIVGTLRSIGRIRLNVNKNNVKAIRSYERNGYQTADAVMIDIGGGYFMDDYIMEKRLEL